MAQEPMVKQTMRRPKVSIMLITYNHEKYIAQALESILMQETEYDFEIAVIEDCSTDKTREIVMQYVEKYPDKVKPYFNKQNIGFKVTQKNFYQGFFRLTGEYIAILEGDDYWTSPHKLQKQVAFLDANLEYVACSHNTIKIYEDGSKEPHRFLYYEGMADEHTIDGCIMLTSYFHVTTLMYRNVFNGIPPRHFRNPWSCELFINMAHAQFGKIRYFDEDMAAYRAHPGGRFSTMPILDGWFFNIGGLRRYNQWLGYRYLEVFSRSIIKYCSHVLADKGKEADVLSRYQYSKYFCIKTFYQGIYSIFQIKRLIIKMIRNLVMKPYDVAEFLSKKSVRFSQFIYHETRIMQIWRKNYDQSKTRFNTVYGRVWGALNSLFKKFIRLCLRKIYQGINALLPMMIRNGIKKLETRYPGIKNFRMSILH